MFENSPAGKAGMRVLYIKGDPIEVKRSATELRCRITVVTNVNKMTGIFRLFSRG